jgi:K+-transporting ATPase ATPase C chain
MIRQLKASVVMLLLLTLVTGIVYPLAVTVIGQVAFPFQANGSLIVNDGQVVGSALIGQPMADAAYFWPRPSATDYAAIPSGASNRGPTSAALAEAVRARAVALRGANGLPADAPLPPDLLLASASGLDPHISPAAARLQIERVAAARGFDAGQRSALADLVEQWTEPPQFNLLGDARVNVLLLNRALDEMS